MTKNLKIAIIALIILILAAAAAYWTVNWLGIRNQQSQVNDFITCAQTGQPVMESYPRQCRTTDGRFFVEELSDADKGKLIPPFAVCENLCGNGQCEEIVCQAIGCPCSETKESCPADCANSLGGNAGLANPASVNCLGLGGKLEIRTGPDGGQAGFCLLANGRACEEWALFRGECNEIK